MRACGCMSTRLVQRCVPVSASTAYTLACRSPKNAASRDAGPATRPMVTDVRTIWCVGNRQYTQPFSASSAYTAPGPVPMKTRPPTTVGWPAANSGAGKPKAHFTASFGTSAWVSPAPAAGWKRELTMSAPQPFHIGAVRGFPRGFAGQDSVSGDVCAAPGTTAPGRKSMPSALTSAIATPRFVMTFTLVLHRRLTHPSMEILPD